MRNPRWILFALLCVPAFHMGSLGQVQPCINTEKFEVGEGCCINPLAVNRIMGRVARQDPDGRIWPDEKPAGCLSLFTADSHEFVKSTTTNQEGKFDFGEIPPGSYRLIARSRGFCTGNIPVNVVRSAWHRHRPILVLFRLSSVDVCTCADYDRK